MESDKNPFPKFDILPHPLKRLGRALLSCVQMHQLSGQSDHFQNTGGGPALDRALYNHYKSAYATYDDGATSPSTYSDLFEQGELF